jgi:hypothetical protein
LDALGHLQQILLVFLVLHRATLQVSFLQLKKELHEATEGRVICNEARWNTT